MGTEWSLVGINLMADFPDNRITGGIVWVSIALAIGGLSYMGGGTKTTVV
jgi:hypothetical protein